MTLQMNEMELLSHGYKLVAVYKKKDWNHSWRCEEAKCYQSDDHYIIRLIRSRSTYTLEYTDPDSANAKVKHLISLGYKKQTCVANKS